MSRLKVTAAVIENGQPREFTVQGQTAKSLLALVDAGKRGVTAQEAASWALRLAAYCHDLIHKFGLVIRTDREDHEGGWHGRHVLESPVEIIEIKRPEGGANG